MNNVPLGIRLLAHSIDACTISVPPRRRHRRQKYGWSLTLALTLVAVVIALAACQ
jgi:hypothetical protein